MSPRESTASPWGEMNCPSSSPAGPVPQPRQQLALAAVDAHARPDVGHVVVDRHPGPDLAHVEAALGARLQIQAGGPVHVVPLGLVPAVAVEDLHAVVLAVGHVHPAVGVAADVVRDVELAGIGARLAPRVQELAVRRVLVHARVAVAVGDVEIALRRQRGVRAAVEGLAAHVGRGHAGHAEGQQHLAVERAVADGVVAVVGQPQRVVGRHVHAVRAAEHALAPRAQEVAVAVEARTSGARRG